ncbi:hypothetical protein Srubr_27120 [Streptomyces rubradiris]|uniref:Uncharacterized protein n=1 Tax=Streptomyces rubradiris TaxID=285531 RepID=A0ABQ3RAJ2_STRRR|nr:hypothetical protein Srubr_27120 [Streptomyces rubradiris]
MHRRAASPEDDLETAQQLTLLVGAKRVPKARKAQLAAAIGRTPEELDVAAKVAKLSPRRSMSCGSATLSWTGSSRPTTTRSGTFPTP